MQLLRNDVWDDAIDSNLSSAEPSIIERARRSQRDLHIGAA